MTKSEFKRSDLEQKYRILVENSPDGICILDQKATILYINRVLPQYRVEDIVGTSALLYISQSEHEEYLKLLKKMFETGEPYSLELHLVGPTRWLSRFIPIMNKGKVESAMVISTDLTEMKRMEEEAQKIEKLESLGLLAGGIAHDFNNILTAILGNISLAKSFLDSKEQLLNRLQEAEKASLRASELAQQLLTFSKGGVPVKKAVSIKEFIEHCVDFALSGSNIQRQFYFQDGLWNLEADEGQLGQVIHNLVINAKQAMPEGGTIRIEVENLTVREEGLRKLQLRPGEYIVMAVRDQGNGILKENLSKIFDPYFTTKEKGSGLGLSVSHSIIRRHQGAITVETKPGKGTTFLIYLPALVEPGIQSEKISKEVMIRGKGKILVMDDEPAVRELVSETLIHLGYVVETAKNGGEAVRRYKNAHDSKKPFDLVITDLTVPGDIGGIETFRMLKEINPKVKVIVSSGYSNDPAMADYKNFGFSGSLQKPYRAFQIGQIVKKVLKV